VTLLVVAFRLESQCQRFTLGTRVRCVGRLAILVEMLLVLAFRLESQCQRYTLRTCGFGLDGWLHSRRCSQAPIQGRFREASTRCVRVLKNVNRSIYGSSHPRHTLVLEKIPATSAPTVQTATRCHVWLFRRLEPLMEMLSHAFVFDRPEAHRSSSPQCARVIMFE